MHFNSLLVLKPFKPNIPDEELANLKKNIGRYKDLLASDNSLSKYQLQLITNRLDFSTAMLNPFFNNVTKKADEILGTYNLESNEEFVSVMADIRYDFESNAKSDYIRLPDGWIFYGFGSCIYRLVNGLVYKRNKKGKYVRNKECKKIKVIHNATPKEAYGTFKRYCKMVVASEYCYNDKTGEYGYYENPNGMFDWYNIGGRWEDSFLVKEDVDDVITDNFNYLSHHAENSSPAPEGYKWVSVARKKDICWDMIYKYNVEWCRKEYDKFIDMIEKHGPNAQIDDHTSIVNGDIVAYNRVIFHNSTTFERFMEIHLPRFTKNKHYIKYETIFDEICHEDGEFEDNYMEKIIDEIGPDDILVSVDCHI